MKQKVVIIGAGPAGLSFALSLADSDLEIIVIEKSSLESLQNPQYDGREIALTITSAEILKKLGVWQKLDPVAISPIKGAKVLNGNSKYVLDFNDGQNNLGYLVSNNLIRKALFERVVEFDNIKIITDLSVEEIKNSTEFANVNLSDKTSIQSSLVVAADSRFSESRRKMNISANMYDFAKTMVLCKIKHSKSHNNIALEWFGYDKVVALLPMTNNVSSLVITLPTNAVKEADNQTILNIAKNFAEDLGEIEVIGEHFSYPLIGVYANKFVSYRSVLIGDAAVGMHPVTAHGFNLGLFGQDVLSKQIKLALANNIDIGDLSVLEKYQSKHIKATKPLYLGTNFIVSLFTNDIAIIKLLRKLTLRIANNKFLPFKRIIVNHLTGKPSRFFKLL